jgi:hypothetical protein
LDSSQAPSIYALICGCFRRRRQRNFGSRRIDRAPLPLNFATLSPWMPRPSLDDRLSIAARVLAASVGGYILTSQTIAVLALLLPLQPSEATLTATMLSFAIYAATILSVFAIRSAWRMGICMVAAIAFLKAMLWAHDAMVWG